MREAVQQHRHREGPLVIESFVFPQGELGGKCYLNIVRIVFVGLNPRIDSDGLIKNMKLKTRLLSLALQADPNFGYVPGTRL